MTNAGDIINGSLNPQVYNVALNPGVDYAKFWAEIETANTGGGWVPSRAVQIVNERPASLRQCWYDLTDAEAEALRGDPRVFCVEIPPEFRTDVQVEGTTSQTGLWYKPGFSEGVNPANNLGINWGLTRTDSRTNNTPGYPPASGNFVHDYLCDGTGIDVVIMDGGIQPDHPEFADANGVSRVQQIDWYAESGVPGTMPSFATFYSDYQGHGTLSAGLACGNLYGRAKNARIYCMTIDVSRTAPTTFIPISDAFDCIKGWHNNKPIDPLTGYKRPTVVLPQIIFFGTYANITGGVYRGTAWTGTTGQTQYGMTGSNNNGTGLYGARVDSVDTDVSELLGAGVHVVAGNGNFYQIVDVVGGQDYNNYYTSLSGGVTSVNYYMRGGSPSATTGVINVGGITQYFESPERIYDPTAKGPRTDLFAPAVGLITSTSTVNGAGATTPYPYNSSYLIGVFNGTSVASPLVGGMVAQMLQAYPYYTPEQIRQAVIDFATTNVLYDAGSTAYTNAFRLHGAANRYAYLPQDLEPFVVPTPLETNLGPTVRELLNDTHRLLNLTASGNVVPEVNYQDNLRTLNQMIDSWSTERLSVFSTQDQVFTWPAGVLSRTLGPTGDFVGNRPVLLDDSTYFRDASTGISYGIKFINQQQYNGIAVKTVTSTFPQVIFVNNTYPNIEMYIYPRPTRALEWHFISVERLDKPATLTTVLSFPPGYLRAFRYNLACELAPEFGIEPLPQVQRIAMTSKRNLKRINNPDDIMSMPYSLVATRQRFNIFAGNY